MSRKWNLLFNALIILVLSVSVALLLNVYDTNQVVEEVGAEMSLARVSAEEIEANQQEEVRYDGAEVRPVTAENIEDAFENINPHDLPVVGGIAIPSEGLNLPIIKGVSDAGMFTGASTLFHDRVMGGVNNYTLASHRSSNDDTLFGPIINMPVGTTVYLSDLENVYTYEITAHETVPPTATEVMDDTTSPILTLITCTWDSNERIIARGELKETMSFDQAPPDVHDAFGTEPKSLGNDVLG